MSRGNKSYGLIKGIMLLLVLSVFVSLASAFEYKDLQFGTGISNKLYRGDVMEYNGYSVKAIAFPDAVASERYSETPDEPVQPFVGLNISKKGSFMNTTILGLGESFITPDGELRVTATSLPSKNATEWLLENYHPWAVVDLSPRSTPHLELSIDTDKIEYSSSDDTEIIVYVTLENTGFADAVNVNMGIDTALQVKTGDLKYHYARLKKGDSVTETVTFISPAPTEDITYSILANVSAYDVKNLLYPAESSKNISIAINPEWSMSLRKTTLEKIYLTDSAMVSLTLKNSGKVDIKNVSIIDAPPKGFKLVSNTSLSWVTNVPAGAEWNYRYLVTPLEPNAEGAVFPVATAEFKVKNELYGIRSNQPKMLVYGPMVTLEKRTDVSAVNPGDSLTVTLIAKNTGSTPTRVFIKDQLPAGTTLAGGVTAYEEFLEAGKEVSFSYTLEIDSQGSIKLPPATAQYYKLGNKGGKITTESNGVEIRIKSPDEANPTVTETPAPTQTPVPVTTPAPTIEPAKSPSSSAVNDNPVKNDTRAMPVKIDEFLSFILGCDDKRTNNRPEACIYFWRD